VWDSTAGDPTLASTSWRTAAERAGTEDMLNGSRAFVTTWSNADAATQRRGHSVEDFLNCENGGIRNGGIRAGVALFCDHENCQIRRVPWGPYCQNVF
jgi:hypothetical protein